MTAMGASFKAVIAHDDPALPPYLAVPAEVVAAFAAETTVAGRRLGRRWIEPRRDGRCFLKRARAQCARLGIGAGDHVEVDVVPAPEMPAEPEAALTARGLQARWARLSIAERRALAEDVFAAARADTRARRIERALAKLEPAP